MFDWDDEELTNILWGVNGKSDDHIVPYHEEGEDYQNKKEWSQEATTIKPYERKTMGTKIDFNGRKRESSSNFNSCERSSASGFGMGSWSDLTLSNASKTDEEPMGTEVSNRIAETANSNSTSELDKDTEFFENPQKGKDQGDFVDYSWANIGSFDDLDRIFSNDDPIFGNVSLGTADELWSSSKDITSSPVKSFPSSEERPSLELGALENTFEHVEINSEFELQDDKLLTLNHGKLNNPAHELQSTHSTLDQEEYAGGKINSFEKEQTNLGTKRNAVSNSGLVDEHVVTPENFADKKNLLRGRRKLEEKSEEKLLQDLHGTWSLTGSRYENQLAHPMLQSSPSSALSQQRQLPKSEALQYQQTNSFVTPSAYGNLTNPYPAKPVLNHIQSGEFKHQSLSCCYDVYPGKPNSVNKSAAPPAKPTMTPQEKIEKLRRQQMQAMLAIQKQQQQFSHQVSRDHSISNPQKFQENQIQLVEGADLEVGDLSILPSSDPNSPGEQEHSNRIYLAVDPVADTILSRLQDAITQLDLRIRLCMRDSLFRLAQSAMQRHYASDTSSTNKSSRDKPEVVTEADSYPSSRYPRMSDAETETNPVDRTIAHLLFHRPLDLPGKHPETLESPVSNKFPCDRAAMSLVNLPMSCMPENSKIMQNLSHQGPNNPCSVPQPQLLDQFKTSPRVETSENASNYGPVDGGGADVETSQ